MKTLEADIEAYEADLKALKEAGPSYEAYHRLHDVEIPALEETLQKHTERQQELLPQFERVGRC